MKIPNVEKWIPNLLLILLFEDGRKHGLGLWLVIMAVALFVLGIGSFSLHELEAFIAMGAGIFTGGNIYDKRDARLNKKIDQGKDDVPSPAS